MKLGALEAYPYPLFLRSKTVTERDVKIGVCLDKRAVQPREGGSGRGICIQCLHFERKSKRSRESGRSGRGGRREQCK